jgi:transcriptional regulator with XRE-family HTH domain
MTGEQLRAARAMVRWEQAELAQRARVSLKTIKRLEAVSGRLDAHSNWAIQNALELAGVEFLHGDEIIGRGDGVRFYTDRTAKLRREIVESVSRELDVALLLAARADEDFFDRPSIEIKNVVSAKVAESIGKSIGDILGKRPEDSLTEL